MAIEARSIDWVPEDERHGRIWHQAPLWFLGNFQYFTIPIGFIGPALGLSLVWSIGASLLGIYGHDWVHRIFRILLYISFPLMSIVTLGVIFGLAGGHTPK